MRGQQKKFETIRWWDYPVTILVAGALGVVGSFISNLMGFFILFVAPVAGVVIAEAVRLVIRKRRGKWLPLVASGAALVGSLISPVYLAIFHIPGKVFHRANQPLWIVVAGFIWHPVRQHRFLPAQGNPTVKDEACLRNFASPILPSSRTWRSSSLKVLMIFTGETGAGKSIILDAINVLVGGKVDATMVRDGADRASLEAEFAIPPETKKEIEEILKREELFEDSQTLTLAREIRVEGQGGGSGKRAQCECGIVEGTGYLPGGHSRAIRTPFAAGRTFTPGFIGPLCCGGFGT